MSFFAYKGFDKDLKCRDFQYEIGKTYSISEKPEICKRGFHFCRKLIDVLDYYPTTILLDDYLHAPYDDYTNIYPIRMRTGNRYCVVEVIGEIDEDIHHDSKGVTNQIKIVRELTKEEFAEITKKERIERDAIVREILFEECTIETDVD